jgi:hypothetical protein
MQQKALPPPIPNGAGRRQSDAKARAAESFARPPPHPRDRTAKIDYQPRNIHEGGGRTQDAEEAEAEEEEEVKPSPIGSRPRRQQLPRGSGGGGGGVQTRRMTRRSAAASRPALSPLTLASPRVNSPQPPPPHSPQPAAAAAAAALACPSSTMRMTRAQAKRFNHSKPDYTPRGGLQSYGDV